MERGELGGEGDRGGEFIGEPRGEQGGELAEELSEERWGEDVRFLIWWAEDMRLTLGSVEFGSKAVLCMMDGVVLF